MPESLLSVPPLLIPAGTPRAGVEWSVSEGLTPYTPAIAAMEARAHAIHDGTAGECVWLVEHPPTYTAGTSAKPEDLKDARFPAVPAGRGGKWTYHGPGQRVAYAMLDLTRPHGPVPARDIRAYVHALEEWMIRALWRFNIRGERREGRVGIWVVRPGGAEEKIGAIGVRVTRWVSWHGLALNLEPDLSHFGGIVPCGIAEHGVTSLHALGVLITMEELDSALMSAWDEVFG
ncbi:lipoyl(octanoyl) transferase LipB [Rhodovarius lipocyclicus]|uniref:lipoyl(octanoyl) transferase LipB n=1 Tax=Rhodovarius lipocyclicus TaxID=268410 RepID=UPI00135A34E5|nr:lipoyl(octanoyl) transferase LipB [Rhodovarius lipocyclicus]